MLTGRYHPRSGVYSTSSGGERIDLDETTIAEVLKRAGYATAAFGKWHSGMQPPYHPNGRGFDEFYGFCSGHWGNYFDPPLEHNGRLVTGKGYVTDDFTDRALQFIETHKALPFFAYLAYNTPHAPMQVPDQWWEKFDGNPLANRHRDPEKENLQQTRAALAMTENIDWNVGRVVTRIEELGLDEQYDHPVLHRQRAKRLAMEREDERAEGLHRRRRCALTASGAMAERYRIGARD